MVDSYSDLNVLAAMTRIEPELPALFGEAWAGVQGQLEADLEALRQSSDADQQDAIAERLVDMMNRFRKTQQRLTAELHIQDRVKAALEHELGDLRTDLSIDERTLRASVDATAFGLRWSLDPDEIPLAKELETRTVTLGPGGVGGGKSIKFRNLALDFGEMSLIVGGAFLAGHEVIKEPNGIVVAAGVLMTISALYKAATVQINEQDASVFWGFIQIRDKKDNTATEADIITSTNKERRNYHRGKLKDEDVLLCLTNLQILKSVAPLEGNPGRWKLVERFTMRA